MKNPGKKKKAQAPIAKNGQTANISSTSNQGPFKTRLVNRRECD